MPKTGSRRKGRILAFQAMFAWDINRVSVDDVAGFSWLDDERRKEIAPDALLFAQLIVSGTLEHIEEVDVLIQNQLEHWDIARVARVDLAVLRISVYSLIYQRDIPASVTIDEAVEIAKEFSGEKSYKFINGVLDGIRRGESDAQ